MILVGTCSWAERTLVESGVFYPKEAKTAEARLRFYASRFDTVEVDSTYYAIPDPKTVWLWSLRTSDQFTFHVKVYGALTGHAIDIRSLPPDIRDEWPGQNESGRPIYVKDKKRLRIIASRFVDTLLPLKRTGKLGLTVFQYPPWFECTSSNMDYILFCRELMGDQPVAVELRHGSWLTGHRARATFDFLRENEITYIVADEPQYGTLATVPFIPHVTSEFAYFRFHGRNSQNWLTKGIATSLRYAYLYSEEEMKELAPAVKDAGTSAKKTFAMFNNCFRAYATTNAAKFVELLSQNDGVSQGDVGEL
jgi:uncharacterized protein YecE (DUF72 family)